MPPPTQPTPIYIKPHSAQVAPSPNPNPTCRACRYSLTNLPAGPCPECGTHFDPQNPATLYNRFSPFHAAVRRAARSRPGWLFINASALTTIPFFILLNAPSPHISSEAEAWLNLILYVPFIFWLVYFLQHLCGRALTALISAPQPRWSWRWFFPPLAFAFCIFLKQASPIWHARWTFARPAFEAVARDPDATPQSIRTFNIREIRRSPDGTVRFRLGFPDALYVRAFPLLEYSPRVRADNPRPRRPSTIPLANNWSIDID